MCVSGSRRTGLRLKVAGVAWEATSRNEAETGRLLVACSMFIVGLAGVIALEGLPRQTSGSRWLSRGSTPFWVLTFFGVGEALIWLVGPWGTITLFACAAIVALVRSRHRRI